MTQDDVTQLPIVVLWEAADRFCGKRLRAALPGLVEALDRHGHLALAPAVREQMLAISPATIDRLLGPTRGQTARCKKRRASPQVRKQVPVRTFADWGDALPGFLEVDMVAHCGASAGTGAGAGVPDAGGSVHGHVGGDPDLVAGGAGSVMTTPSFFGSRWFALGVQ